jgi:UDP-2,3-diacylglucosamine hydrolase
MSEEREQIGIIAGGGRFPMMVADAARARGCRTVAVAHDGETAPELGEHVDELVWVRLGQLGRLIRAFRERGVQRVMMAGTIAKRRMFSRVRPDLKGLALMSRMAVFHDDGILRSVSREMEKEGIQVIPSTRFLPELMAPAGVLTRRRPTKSEASDIRFGWRMAKELGRLDIGQCVVVRRKTVVALEAMEGTDETIRRGGGIAREKAVVVKVSKPDQDLRFDVPSVGLETVRVMSEAGASVLALEAAKTLLFEKADMIRFADEKGISIVAMENGEDRF